MTLLTIPLWFTAFAMPLVKDRVYPILANLVNLAMVMIPIFIFFESQLLLLHMMRRAMGADIFLRRRLLLIAYGIVTWTFLWHQLNS